MKKKYRPLLQHDTSHQRTFKIYQISYLVSINVFEVFSHVAVQEIGTLLC